MTIKKTFYYPNTNDGDFTVWDAKDGNKKIAHIDINPFKANEFIVIGTFSPALMDSAKSFNDAMLIAENFIKKYEAKTLKGCSTKARKTTKKTAPKRK